MLNKRGQFFLIAALVIVGIMFGLVTVYNVATTSKEDTTVYDLSDEINFEAAQVIDNKIFDSTQDLNSNLQNITDFYSDTNPQSDFLVLYGDEDGLTAIFYNSTESGSINIAFGGDTTGTDIKSTVKTIDDTLDPDDKSSIRITFGITQYDFNLRPGQIFYLVIKKENQEERYVSGPGEISTQ